MSRRAGLALKSSRMTGERNNSTLDLERSPQPQMTLLEVRALTSLSATNWPSRSLAWVLISASVEVAIGFRRLTRALISQKKRTGTMAGPLTPPNACLAFSNDRRRGFALAVVLRTARDAEESKHRGQ